MGLMKKAVRRATPKPVRKAKRIVRHPARTAVRAATPRSIRQVKRTAFNATHPINPAENALLKSLTGASRRSSSSGGSSNSGRSHYSAGYATATEERLRVGEAIAEAENANFSVHLRSVEVATRPLAPPITEPDPAPERQRLEANSGATELTANLEPFGSPPTALPPEPVSVKAIKRELYTTATASVPRWNLKERHNRRARARQRAVEDAERETEQRADRQKHEQDDLNASWSRLEGLRTAAESDARQWVAEETARREGARESHQLEMDAAWSRLKANDPEMVAAALRDAFGEAAISVVGMILGTSTALVAVVVPRLEDSIADREAGYTPTGRPTLNERTKTRMNEMYLAVLASRILYAANVALAAAPGLDGVRCVAVRVNNSGMLEPIYAGTLRRPLRQVLITDLEVLARVPGMALDVKLTRRGRAHELSALAPDADASVKAVMDLAAAASS
jgi:hypothetical protein